LALLRGVWLFFALGAPSLKKSLDIPIVTQLSCQQGTPGPEAEYTKWHRISIRFEDIKKARNMLLEDTGKEKRINAIRYFCKHTKKLSETKLYKLLFFLDFLHFKEVGRPVTDLEYFAWDYGPVPTKLFFEIKEKRAPKEILKCIVPERDLLSGEIRGQYFKSIKSPDLEVFSEREIRILKEVSDIFRDAKATEMTEITHLKNEPWHKTLEIKGEKAKIDFLLALDKDAKIDEDLARERLEFSTEMKKLFSSGE